MRFFPLGIRLDAEWPKTQMIRSNKKTGDRKQIVPKKN